MIYPLDNPILPYAWGSRTVLAELLGEPSPSPEPQAELWMGAHPSASSRLPDGSALNARIAADPVGELGAAVEAEFGSRLPFLAKLLAAEAPLSLQVHPTTAQAARGFAAEEAAAIPIDAPTRTYRDAWHKPELICALTPFTALTGFRPRAQTIDLLTSLTVPGLTPLIDALAGADGLRSVVAELLGDPDPGLALQVARACADPGPFPAERRTGAQLGEVYPGDPGLVVALLLNRVRLAPGEALFLAAGAPHMYLSGFGVEVMANSDNVLRGGLTVKHVDVPELLTVLDFSAAPPPFVSAVSAPGELVYDTPAREFRLSRLLPGAALDGAGPQIVVCVEGSVVVSRGDASAPLAAGQSAYLPAGRGSTLVGGHGAAYRVGVNLDAPGVA